MKTEDLILSILKDIQSDQLKIKQNLNSFRSDFNQHMSSINKMLDKRDDLYSKWRDQNRTDKKTSGSD
jgi:hypothetical protein